MKGEGEVGNSKARQLLVARPRRLLLLLLRRLYESSKTAIQGEDVR
jgi:hypothetical protein